VIYRVQFARQPCTVGAINRTKAEVYCTEQIGSLLTYLLTY